MTSGNFMVDAEDAAQAEEERNSRLLECGCRKGLCLCDSAWDEID